MVTAELSRTPIIETIECINVQNENKFTRNVRLRTGFIRFRVQTHHVRIEIVYQPPNNTIVLLVCWATRGFYYAKKVQKSKRKRAEADCCSVNKSITRLTTCEMTVIQIFEICAHFLSIRHNTTTHYRLLCAMAYQRVDFIPLHPFLSNVCRGLRMKVPPGITEAVIWNSDLTFISKPGYAYGNL